MKNDVAIGIRAFENAVVNGDVKIGEPYEITLGYGDVAAITEAADGALHDVLAATLEAYDLDLVGRGIEPEELVDRGIADDLEMVVTIPAGFVRDWFIASQVATRCF